MRSSEGRRRLAAEAARIISASGDDDRERALRKAAARLGLRGRAAWPDEAELAEALAEHQRLFRGDAQGQALHTRRQAALEAMRFFSGFRPRLSGPVLDGTADTHSVVSLHLHSDDPEAVARFLHEHRIPADARSRRVRVPGGAWAEAPLHGFDADAIGFELLVLPLSCLPSGPVDANGAAATLRCDLRGLQRLLGEG